MKKEDDLINIVDTIFTDAANRQLMYLNTEDHPLDGRTIGFNGKEYINFGSCSYLGLEIDPRLKQGVIDAVTRYGTQFSSSRSYMSAPPYVELEDQLSQLFGGYALVTPSTTLGHLSALRVLVKPNHAVIMDRQVHASVQMAANQCRLQGVPVEIVLHSHLDALEQKIKSLRDTHDVIWYLADGVYSMYGDLAPLPELMQLLEKYPQLHLYIDDAHGMSWTGKSGRGYTLGAVDLRERMVVATSLNKAFACAGGCLVFPNEEMRRRVKTCGQTIIFSGPVQPPMLGAALASARLHLSPEFAVIQNELKERIVYCNTLLEEAQLPVVAMTVTPIEYICTGLWRVALNMVKRIHSEGYYVNPAPFPAVPMKCCGIRFTLTRHQTFEDIKGLVDAIKHHFPLALAEENYSLEEIKTAFQEALPATFVKEFYKNYKQAAQLYSTKTEEKSKFTVIETKTIHGLSQELWDNLFYGKGSFSHNGMRYLEDTFGNNPEKENNWKFHYFVIKDRQDRVVLATFFTECMVKDDLLSPGSISAQIETMRTRDPHYFTSHCLQMGSLFTEGRHLYINPQLEWRDAFLMLLKRVKEIQETCGADMILLRDFPKDDDALKMMMLEQGYVQTPMPDTHVVDNSIWKNGSENLLFLPPKFRRFIRKEVLPFENQYAIKIFNKESSLPSEQELDYFYSLYKNVKGKSLEINVFDLPKTIFKNMLRYSDWEIMALYLKQNGDLPVSVVGCFKNGDAYCPGLIGLDYRYLESCSPYRQTLYQTIKRATELGFARTHFGETATLEKRRLGATAYPIVAYFLSKDTFKLEVLSQMQITKKSKVVYS